MILSWHLMTDVAAQLAGKMLRYPLNLIFSLHSISLRNFSTSEGRPNPG